MIWPRVISLVLGVVLQAIALYLLWQQELIALAVLAHLAGAAAWGFGISLLLPLAQQTAWWLPGGAALIAPVLGPLASLAIIQLLRTPPPDYSAQRYLVWDEQPVSATSATLPSGASGQSIVEILQSPRTELRRNAILALRDLDPQFAIQLLRKGLQDSDEQVRIYAQNILSGMIERFESGLKELEQRLAAEPNAALHAVRVAEQYYELVYLDVAGDDQTAAHYLNKALALLARAAELAPADGEIALLGLKCSLRARNVELARTWFAQVQARPHDHRQVLPWAMELAYMEKDWPRLRTLFATFDHAQTINPRIEALAHFWTGAPQPEKAA